MRTILRIFAACALWVALWCAAIAAAWAVDRDIKPPRWLIEEIAQGVQVHDGDCKVDSMGIDGEPCLIYVDGQRSIIWIVLFDGLELTDGLAAHPQVSRIVRAQDGSETMAWCREDVCK